MSKIEDLNSEKFKLSEDLLRNTQGGRGWEHTEGDPSLGSGTVAGTGADYSTAPGVSDNCDYTTNSRDYVKIMSPCGVSG